MLGETAKSNVEPSTRLTAIGKYKLIASLAQGGMAKVYLGLMAGPAGFNKLLVIKVMNREDENLGEDAVQQFWDEARLAARMIHSNIVHTYEVGEEDGRLFFLAMEYLDGQSLRTLQNKLPDERVPLEHQLRILAETARGLQYAHDLKDFKGESLGVVHRDVSPQNVFITYDGQVKLLDFGIAKSQDSDHKTKVGVIKGKLDYIAPEQLSGDHVDARADVFALGAMLWEAVTGQRFSGGRNVPEVKKIHARLTGAEPKVRSVIPDVPEALAVIIDRAIAVSPEERMATAAEFADALDAYIASIGSRPSAKALGEAMASIFAAERTRMHKLIDQQIEATRNDNTLTSSLPNLALHSTVTSTVTPSDHRPAQAAPSTEVATAGDAKVAARKPGMLVAGALALAAIVVGWALASRDEPAPEASAAAISVREPERAPTPADTAPTPKQDVGAAMAAQPQQDEARGVNVTIELKVSPPDARLTLDGAELPVPFKGEFRRGAELHQVAVTAKGYQSHKRLLDFSKDQSIEIVLAPAPQGRNRGNGSRELAESEPQAPTPTTPPPAQPEPTRKPGFGADLEVKTRPPSTIDTFNPYKK